MKKWLTGKGFREDFCSLFLSLLWSELLFKLLTFKTLLQFSTLRILLYLTCFSLLICFITSFMNRKWARKTVFTISMVIAVYTFVQLEFRNFMGNYMSVKTVGGEAGRITDYVVSFLAYAKIPYYFVFAAPIVQKIYYKKHPVHPEEKTGRGARIWNVGAWALVFCIFLSSLNVKASAITSLQDLYQNPSFLELALREFGVTCFLERDIVSVFHKDTQTIIVQSETETASASASSTPAAEKTHDSDDAQWRQAAAEETDSTRSAIDSYLLSKTVSTENEMTGTLEGYNLIYILVESFDYMAVNETLTPTLYKMQQSGYSFDNYYTPKYSCTTGESEFISLTSLVPQSDVCTPNNYENNSYPESIFQLFKNAGYYTSAYHNWKDEFYDRAIYFPNMGADDYKDVNDLGISLIQGWQSDADLVTSSMQYYMDKEPYFTFYVTSSTHFPYDTSSTLGDKYLDQVNEVMPDAPMEIKRYMSKAMELDKAMEILLNQLEENGQLDHTVLVMFADHHPLKLAISEIAEYTTQLDRTVGLNEDRTPCFVYSPGLTSTHLNKTASTFDLLPTMANLFGLDYDSRFYVGTDYFDDQEGVAIFTNGDWVSDHGIYYASEDRFEPAEGQETDSAYVSSVSAMVSNQFTISKAIFQSDYFKYRNFSETTP